MAQLTEVGEVARIIAVMENNQRKKVIKTKI
jgi:hypothetical protein